jgi:hypothetical protein
MIELPEIKPITEREQALMWVMKGNHGSVVTNFYYNNVGDSVCCYCIFEHEPTVVVDFSGEFTYTWGRK